MAKKRALSALPENIPPLRIQMEMPDAPTALLDISNLLLSVPNATHAVRELTPPVLQYALSVMPENILTLHKFHVKIAELANILPRVPPPAQNAYPALPATFKDKAVALNAQRTRTFTPMSKD